MAFLEVKNLRKRFGDTEVLKGIDFTLEKGEVISVIGSSGNGKTTLLRCLNFLEMPESGSISVGGEEIFDAQKKYTDAVLRQNRLRFGLVFQSFNLFPQYSALKNVQLALDLQAKERFKKQKKSAAELKRALSENASAAEQILTDVGLKDKLKNYPCELSGGQCQRVAIARALIGNRSAVVVKTPSGDVKARSIPAGNIELLSAGRTTRVDVAAGADAIMKAVGECPKLENVTGEPGTNIGGMLEHVRQTMAELTNKPSNEIFIQDLLAIDTSVPVSVTGGLAGEFSLEQAVGIASMVKSDRLQMAMIASEIKQKLHVDVQVGGAEAEAAIQGALTTPGTTRPLAILDLGAGSTDASIINQSGEIVATHLAGAGDMVTMIIARELGLNDRYLAEEIKKYPLAKVESLFHLRHEDGSVQFFPTPLSPHVFARVCVVKPDELVPIPGDLTLEKVRAVRRSAKERVFVTNALRALRQVSPGGNIRDIPFVVLVGGSSLDFEVPQLVTDALAHYRLVAGRGNIRGSEGPRNAVATGLLISWHRELAHGK